MSTSKGKEMGGGGPPTFGSVYDGSPISPWGMADGRLAAGGSEVVIDRGTAKRYDVKVDDKISITTQVGTQEFTVVGTARFAGNDSTGGATWALFDLPTAQAFVNGKPGLVDSIVVGGDGTLSAAAARRPHRADAAAVRRHRTSRCSPASRSPRRTRATSSAG